MKTLFSSVPKLTIPIGQVLTNYLTDALKYAPADQAISVCLEATATTARVAVSDRGPGLTEQQQQRIWERFYRAVLPRHQGAATGLGLGLAIAKAIIEQHQGEVGVESVPGQGSAFWFTLPLATSRSRHEEATLPHAWTERSFWRPAMQLPGPLCHAHDVPQQAHEHEQPL